MNFISSSPIRDKQFLNHLVGLRGVAIVLVVLFHLRPDFFSQGYLGVDIFLVISGYLLFRNANPSKNTFRFLPFINKKIIRVIPLLSLLIVIASVAVFPVLFSTKAIEDVGACGLSSLFCLSNVHYIQKYSNYFATNANLNPFLHTWYLAVIMQCYVIWAIVNSILRKCNQTVSMLFVVVVGVASLVYFYSLPLHDFLNKYQLPVWEQTRAISYYDTFGRIWQLCAGAFVFILPFPRSKYFKYILSSLGLLIISIILLSNEHFLFAPIFIVLATILVIKYTAATPVSFLLENTIMKKMGEISFSIYIIHFPILVIFKRYTKESPDFLDCVALIVIILFCAYFFWKCAEKRNWKRFCIVVLFTVATFISGLFRFHQKLGVDFFENSTVQYPLYAIPSMPDNLQQHLMEGFDSELLISAGGVTTLHEDDNKISCGQQANFLPLGTSNRLPEFVVVGDSNAQQLYAGFHEICKDKNISGVFLSTVVVPLWDWYTDDSASYSWNRKKYDAFINWLKAHPEIHTVVVAQYWNRIIEREIIDWNKNRKIVAEEQCVMRFERFCSDLRQEGRQVIVLSQTPVLVGFPNNDSLGQGLEYARWRLFRYGTTGPLNSKDPIILSQDMYNSAFQRVNTVLHALARNNVCKILDLSIFDKDDIKLISKDKLNFKDRGHITPAQAIEILTRSSDEFIKFVIQGRSTVNTNITHGE